MGQKNRPETVRGPALREKIVESERRGEESRSQNQGSDIIDTNIRHSDNTTKNRVTEERTKK